MSHKGNLVDFPTAQPKPPETEILLLRRKIAFQPPEKHILLQYYVKSDNFGQFRKIRWANEKEITYTPETS